MKDWISVKELAEIKGVTPRAIRKAISNNKYISRNVQTGTGIKYEVLFNPLNNNVQNCIDFEKSKIKIDKNREPETINNEIVPTHAKQIALARFDLVNLWIDYKSISKRFRSN